MAVDYGNKATPPSTQTSAVAAQTQARTQVVLERPSEIEVFLALLVSHTTAAGGTKYWGNPKNLPGNVSRLKSLAQQIVEAY